MTVRVRTAGWVLLGLLSAAAGPASAQQVRYYHLDAIGSVRGISDSTGAIVERHDYSPFGEECTTGTCAVNPGLGGGQPKKFTGKERDPETGLDYFGARYYGMRIGRFTSIDPVTTWKENLADPLRWNRYAYSRSNPLRYVDPDGKKIVASGSPAFLVAVGNARATMDRATSVYRQLDDRPETFTIVETTGLSESDVEYTPGSRTISWNPRFGVELPEGIGLSPVTLLAHEMDHALRSVTDPEGFRRDSVVDTRNPYRTADDERVITRGAEADVARARGETARTSHEGKPVAVKDETQAPGPRSDR